MKRTVSSVNKKIALCAALSALAVVLSYLEAVSGINALMPVTGTKLGLANAAVTVTAYSVSLYAGAVVSFIRVLVMSMLFGSPTTFVFSPLGAIFAYTFIALTKLVPETKISLIGVSVGASAMHMLGQLIAACVMLADSSVIRLLPLYLALSVVPGVLTGALSLTVMRLLARTRLI